MKADATRAFKAGTWAAARDLYVQASAWVDDDYDFVEPADTVAARELHSACLLNAAQCSLKLSEWPGAASSCTKVLKIAELPDAARVKALFRRGTARIKMAEFEDARAPMRPSPTLRHTRGAVS